MSNTISAAEHAARINELLGEVTRLEHENNLLRSVGRSQSRQVESLTEKVKELTRDLRRWEGSTRTFGDRQYHGSHVVKPRYSGGI